MTVLAQAMWAHGTSMQFKSPELANMRRLGWGVGLEGAQGSASWLHSAIPRFSAGGDSCYDLAHPRVGAIRERACRTRVALPPCPQMGCLPIG